MIDFDFNKRYVFVFKQSPHEWAVKRDSNYKPTYENCSSTLGTLRDLEKYIRIIQGVAGTEERLKEAKFDAQYIVDGYFNKMGCWRKIYDYIRRFFGYKVEQDEIRELNIQIQSKGRTFSEVLSKDLFYYVSKWLSYQDIARLAQASTGCKSVATSMLYRIAKEFGYSDKEKYKPITSYLKVVNGVLSRFYQQSLFKSSNSEELKSSKDLKNLHESLDSTMSLIIDIFKKKPVSSERVQEELEKILFDYSSSFYEDWSILNFLIYHLPSNNCVLETCLHVIFDRHSELFFSSLGECLIERGVDVNALDENNKTLLHKVIQKRNFTDIDWLFKHGADPKKGRVFYALYHSSFTEDKSKELAKLLIEKGADIDEKDAVYKTYSLFDAVCHGNRQMIHWFLNRGANPNRHSILAQTSDPEIIKLIIEKGADIQGLSWEGIKSWNLEFVQWLLDNGANLNPCLGVHPLSLTKDQQIVKFLLERGASLQALAWEGIESWTLEFVQGLLKQGANPNQGYPLHQAIREGRQDIAELLVNYQANIDRFNKDGNTPLELACENRDIKMIEWLLKTGADVKKGCIFVSLVKKPIEGEEQKEVIKNLVELLLEKGADINKGSLHYQIRTEDDQECKITALNILIGSNQIELIEFFLKKGADVCLSLSLWSAVFQGNVKIVKLALQKGADPNIVLNKKEKIQTVLDAALGSPYIDEKKRIEIVKLLFDHGVDPKLGDSLVTALFNKQFDIAELLIQKGVDPACVGRSGKTPLEILKDCGRKKPIEWLENKLLEVN